MPTKKQLAEIEKIALGRWNELPLEARQTEFQAADFAEQIEREYGVRYKSVLSWIVRHERLKGHPLSGK